MKKFLFLVLSLSVVLPTSCSRLSLKNEHVYIVSIGLDYADTQLPYLNGTKDDAQEVAVCLCEIYTAKGIENTVFLSTQSTADEIMTLLESIEFNGQSTLVFYWSGHGHYDEDGVFLVAYSNDERPYTKMYLEDLLLFTESLACPSVLILDSCYSGAAVREKAFGALNGLDLEKSAVLASCGKDELSVISYVRTQEGPVQAHSLFTITLLSALGWKHSLDSPNKGYLVALPKRLSVSRLGEEIRFLSGDSVQHPVFGRTDIPVFIIP